MSPEENKALVRRYIEAVDSNHSSDWSIIDDFLSEDFVAHNPPVPGVSLDREGMKQASEISATRPQAPTRSPCKSPRETWSSATSAGAAPTRGSCSASRRPIRKSKPKGSLSTASGTRRSSSTGRLSTWSTCCNKSALFRNRRPETPAPGAVVSGRSRLESPAEWPVEGVGELAHAVAGYDEDVVERYVPNYEREDRSRYEELDRGGFDQGFGIDP